MASCQYYRLDAGKRPILPTDHWLIVNDQKMILTLERNAKEGEEFPPVLAQEVFSPTEWSFLEKLLEAFPNYISHASMLSHLTGEKLERCQEKVNYAYEFGNLDSVMHPVRNYLSRCRSKLFSFGIHVASIQKTGYCLLSLQEVKYNKK